MANYYNPTQGMTAAQITARAQSSGLYVSPILDPTQDLTWGQHYQPDNLAPSNYFDYFYSGQDIRVYVDGTEMDPVLGNMPIESLGYSIRQQKAPIYGYWSYSYDGVMRGNRIVEGQFVLITQYPDYFTRVLQLAAKTRGDIASSSSYFRNLTQDEQNLETYWSNNMDPEPGGTTDGLSLFSSHPPFNLVIIYGIQAPSVAADGITSVGTSLKDAYDVSNSLLLDTNERLVESDPVNQSGRVILDSCEITGMETVFSSNGSPIGEQYSFFARDMLERPWKAS